jgi:hypothetical protein
VKLYHGLPLIDRGRDGPAMQSSGGKKNESVHILWVELRPSSI